MEQVLKLAAAVRALRQRSGDITYGTQLGKGKYQLVRVVYAKSGKSTVTPLSDWMDADTLIAHINSL